MAAQNESNEGEMKKINSPSIDSQTVSLNANLMLRKRREKNYHILNLTMCVVDTFPRVVVITPSLRESLFGQKVKLVVQANDFFNQCRFDFNNSQD